MKTRPHNPQTIFKIEGERVGSFKFLHVHNGDDLTWTYNQAGQESPIMAALPEKTEKIGHVTNNLEELLQLHHAEHRDQLNHCLVPCREWS